MRRHRGATRSRCRFATGEVAKWLRQRFAKPSRPKGARGFESHPLRWPRWRERRLSGWADGHQDRCPRGLRSTIGNRVGRKPSWVRIPPCP
jgi:hypothetical protein